MGKEIVRPFRRNWDVDYITDIINNKGFTITEPTTINDEDSKKKSLFGARSPLYGTDYEDEQAFLERYRCKCGEFQGEQFKGEVCPLCGEMIEARGIDVGYTGWISLGKDCIIQPYYYNLLLSVIGRHNLPDIVNSKKRVDKNGNMKNISIDDQSEKPRHPFVGIGTLEFRERFEEIMNWFAIKRPNKADRIKRIIDEKYNVFTSHIPVYSTILRQQSSTSDTYYYNPIDKHINPIYSLSEKLKDAEEIDKMFILSRIQYRVNELWNINFELLNGKDGWIQDQIIAGQLNNTSRNVIIPNPALKDNEVDLSYCTFLEMFKYQIINTLMKMDGVTLSKAYTRWKEAFIFDNKIYEIMLYIIKTEQPRVLINRNPTLNNIEVLKQC